MSGARATEKVTAPQLLARKRTGPKITALTAYDEPTGRIVDSSGVDVVLVGDSLGNVVLGYPSTLPVTLSDLVHHVRAVRAGVSRALLVADMPFRSVGISVEDGVRSIAAVVAEAGAEAVKVEGASPTVLGTIRRSVEIGVPVMGHVGLTPQSVHRFGGYRRQGVSGADAARIVREARSLAAAGAFSIVLECVPAALARRVTRAVPVPTIGIAAGRDCDGQILVFHDLVGLSSAPPPFVKPYARLADAAREAVSRFASDVRRGSFPPPGNE